MLLSPFSMASTTLGGARVMRFRHGVFQFESWTFLNKDFDGGFTKALGGHAWIEVAKHAGKNVKGFMRNGWWN